MLSTELNSLANGAFSNASTTLDNSGSTAKHLYFALELVLASLTPTGAPYIAVYALYSIDGTNYEDGGGSTAPPLMSQIAAFDLSTSTGAKRRTRVNVPAAPFPVKFVVENRAGVSLASSGNTLSVRSYSYDTP